MEELLGTRYEEVNKKKGVKKLFDAMIRKKSVLIGHNFNLDVLFIISHFGDTLPPTLKEYKEMLKKYFSKIYDTKYLFENLRQEYKEFQLENETTNLEAIYTHLKKLSNNIKYGTMGLSTAIMWAKVFYESIPARNILSPAVGATIAAPLIIGTTFCLGTYSGRAIRELDNHPMR